MNILEELIKLSNSEYKDFNAKLNPNIDKDCILGVKVPKCRELAKTLYKENNYEPFISQLPHKYFEENMLHGLIIGEFTEFEKCIEKLNTFLPYVDNWAVCDSLKCKCFKKNKDKLIPIISEWVKSKDTFVCRYGVNIFMDYFLDEDFKPEYLEIIAGIKSDEYYIKMVVAWYFATALAKQWDSSIPYIENSKLSTWVNNKTIQKAKESFRITKEQKDYLSKYKK